MAKWYGLVGYISTEEVETAPGVWEAVPTEREYYGDLVRNHKRFDPTQQLNDDLKLQNEISIVADPYAMHHFHEIRYVYIEDVPWKVTAVDVQYPRLTLSIGGVYNGATAAVAG